MSWLGDFPFGFATVTCMFTTHAATGAPVAPSSSFENTDVKIYKNGSDVERSSVAGITMTSPFDSITGLHCVTIDLSDDTDPGFYTAGSVYTLVCSPDETVNVVAFIEVIGQFSIAVASLAVWQTDTSSGFSVGTAGNRVNSIADIDETVSDTFSIVNNVLDGDIYDDLTLEEAIQVILAAVAGKASGLETTTAVYRDITDNRDVITATVDEFGNRTAVTLNP